MSDGSPFDYSFLAPQVAEVCSLESKSTLNVIKIGDVLLFAKNQLIEHGLLTGWIERELPISVRTAQRYMAMAKLAKGKHDTVSLLTLRTVRILAQKFTPSEIVAEVIAQAAVGKILSESEVEAMLSAVRDTKRQAKREAEDAARKSEKEKAAAERAVRRVEKKQKQQKDKAQARSIIDRLAIEDVRFLANTLTYEVLDEFLRLVREGGAA